MDVRAKMNVFVWVLCSPSSSRWSQTEQGKEFQGKANLNVGVVDGPRHEVLCTAQDRFPIITTICL